MFYEENYKRQHWKSLYWHSFQLHPMILGFNIYLPLHEMHIYD